MNLPRITTLLLLVLGIRCDAVAASVDPIQEARRLLARGDVDRAETVLREALQEPNVPRADPTSADAERRTAQLQETLAAVLAAQGRFDEAHATQSSVVAIRATLLGPNDELVLHGRANLAAIELARGNIREAQRTIFALLESKEAPGTEKAAWLQRLATTYLEAGDIPSALSVAVRIRDILRADPGPSVERQLTSLTTLAQLGCDLQMPDLTHAALETISALRPDPPPNLQAWLEIIRAETNLQQNGKSAVLSDAPTFAAVCNNGPPSPVGVMLTLRWLRVLRGMGRAADAWRLDEEMEHATANARFWNPKLRAEADLGRAETAWLAGHTTVAVSAAEAALARWASLLAPTHPSITRAHRLLAYLALDTLDSTRAREHARQAAAGDAADLARLLRFGTEETQIAQISDLHPFNLACTVGDLELILAQLATFKSAVVDALAREARGAARARAAGQAAQWDRRHELRMALWRPQNAEPTTLTRALTDELAQIERTLDLEPMRTAPFDYAAARRALPADAALVEYIRYDHYLGHGQFEPRYGAIVLTRDASASWHSAGSADRVDALVNEVRLGALFKRSPVALEHSLTELSELVWQPLRPRIDSSVHRLFLVADASLQVLPFSVLPHDTAQRLLERFGVVHLSSARDLVRQRPITEGKDWTIVANPTFALPDRDPPDAPDALREANARAVRAIVGRGFEDLPGTAHELDRLEQILPHRWIALHEANATEPATRELLAATPAVVHFATHGFFLDPLECASAAGDGPLRISHPLQRSGLALAGINNTFRWWENGVQPDPADDGMLTAAEIAALDLTHTRLVVLSACDTARGRVVSGEGVLGLRRAFQLAGVSALVATLWTINDTDTAAFMADFYAELAEGRAMADVFAAVQRKQFREHFTAGGLARATNRAAPFVYCAFDVAGATLRLD